MGTALTRQTFLGLVAAGSVGVAGLVVLAPAVSTPAGASAAGRAPVGMPAQAPRVEVTLRPWLAQHSVSRRQRLSVPYQPGVTPAAIAETEGFHDADLGSIMAVVNGVQTDLTTSLSAGDHLELITGMAGG